MAAITEQIISATYDVARQVHQGKLTHSAAVSILDAEHNMNRSSASDYINNLSLMLRGSVYKRTNSVMATDYFLSNIENDFETREFIQALESVALHISYYEELTSVNLRSLREVLSKHTAKIGEVIEPVLSKNAKTKIISKSNAVSNSIKTMIRNARLADGMSGTTRIVTQKLKKVKFGNDSNFIDFIDRQIREQDGKCAITGLTLQYNGTHTDKNYLCSLDRIDSEGNYEASNLQVVCQFINRWKSDSDNEEFKQLISEIQTTG